MTEVLEMTVDLATSGTQGTTEAHETTEAHVTIAARGMVLAISEDRETTHEAAGQEMAVCPAVVTMDGAEDGTKTDPVDRRATSLSANGAAVIGSSVASLHPAKNGVAAGTNPAGDVVVTTAADGVVAATRRAAIKGDAVVAVATTVVNGVDEAVMLLRVMDPSDPEDPPLRQMMAGPSRRRSRYVNFSIMLRVVTESFLIIKTRSNLLLFAVGEFFTDID